MLRKNIGTAISKNRQETCRHRPWSREASGLMGYDSREKGTKGERRMPRLQEARKDVVSCEKARGAANRH